jgi:aminoglycoside phosphotransferase (APT) family kinase protein
MSSAVAGRDLVETARALEDWLVGRLDGVADSLVVSELSVPKAGFSNETICGHVQWNSAHGAEARDFVVRIEPTSHQLFVEPDAMRQARVMSELAGRVPVPNIWLTETSSDPLGAPFFLMDRVHGRIPGDVPSWHKRGWTTELDSAQRFELHDNALRALAALHAIDTNDAAFEFLLTPGDGTPLQRYVNHVAAWHEWCLPVLRHDVDTINAAMRYVLDAVPRDARRSIVWGDARVGNIVFGDDLSVAAMLDWEGATLGPPEIDVAWWVMFDEFLCEANGLTRLAGVPDRRGTLARYSEIAGHPLRDIEYYEVLAGLQFSLINSRLAHLLITSGSAPESFVDEFVYRTTAITRRSLERLTAL